MNQNQKNKLLNYSIALGFILILLAGIFLISYFLNRQRDVCLNNPLVYGAKQLEQKYGVPARGSIILRGRQEEVFVYFTSKNISISSSN